MDRSELLSLIAIFVAALAALYARWGAIQARKANKISIELDLKPRRLSAYKSVNEFIHFCSIYRTKHFHKMVDGTGELVAEIDSFEWEIKQHGPLDMPDIEKLLEAAKNKAWQLQRLLDRLDGPEPKPLENKYVTIQDNLNDVSDWFSEKEKELKELFEPYLRITQPLYGRGSQEKIIPP